VKESAASSKQPENGRDELIIFEDLDNSRLTQRRHSSYCPTMPGALFLEFGEVRLIVPASPPFTMDDEEPLESTSDRLRLNGDRN
jgi:hypothetical protein